MELCLRDVCKQFQGKMAVDHLTVILHSGIYGLLGPNGAGKTTTMRMICDILRPDSGQITLDGVPVSALGEDYRDLLGYLPQNYGYYPEYTGWDFLMYFAALKGLPRFMAQERCEKLLSFAGLTAVRKKKLKTYSGGMRQRLGIALAMLNDPRILILDEPTSGLDPKERAKFRTMIGQLSGERIVLVATHIVSDAQEIAEQILIMKHGRLGLQGTPEELSNQLRGKVWNFRIPAEQALPHTGTLVSSRRWGDEMEVRMIAESVPAAGAVLAEPSLEDLYLYYFREDEPWTF